MMIKEGELLWEPNETYKRTANISQFIDWLEQNHGLIFNDYNSLWRWSVEDIEAFWSAVWDYFEVQSGTPYDSVLPDRNMPGAEWFPGSHLNFSEHILRHERADTTALFCYSELHEPYQVSWEELGNQTRVLAQQLRNKGVQPGDRVATYLPNTLEAVVVLLATAAVGGIFSSCSPDFGYDSVVDRFLQIEPKVLFCTDGYRFNGKDFDRRDAARRIIDSLPSLEHVIQVPNLLKSDSELIVSHAMRWENVLAGPLVSIEEFNFEQVPFNHPLWVLYSSGTTGLPKPIVHSHGGITLEFLKVVGFHMNQKPDSVMFFYTTTSWMMWNFVVGSLIMGGAVVLYDGHPAGGDPSRLWRIAEDSGATFFGASPTYIAMIEKLNIVPKEKFDLSRMEGILLGGSPATPEAMAWCYNNIKKDLWVTSQSGGTDICSAFVGASPTLPVYAGEIQVRCLGVDVKAYNDKGESVVNEVGELVVCQPMPSMPIYFWDDRDNARYLASYFEDFPGIWRHGDYFLINERGGCFIYGRSDSTLNRYGIRIGTAEIYRTVEKLDEIEDSLIVNLDLAEGKFFMPLFVKLKDGVVLDNKLQDKICMTLRQEYSPRHVPDKIIQVDLIPYTLTNKKMEVPVRKILSGVTVNKAANKDTMADQKALDFYIQYAKTTTDYEMPNLHS